MSEQYPVPKTQLSLSGSVVFPEPGQLPMRGDLAHIALADRYLVAHYVVPQACTMSSDCPLRISPDETADEIAALEIGGEVELLDIAGQWAWVCQGPDGPTGYVPLGSISQ